MRSEVKWGKAKWGKGKSGKFSWGKGTWGKGKWVRVSWGGVGVQMSYYHKHNPVVMENVFQTA